MLRRYTPLKASRGTRFPPEVFIASLELHGGCLAPVVGMPGDCQGALEPDHIRASGAIGMKSRSTLDNCAPLCSAHHRLKTLQGRTWRPKLIEAVELAMGKGCPHVEPVHGCPVCVHPPDPYTVGLA